MEQYRPGTSRVFFDWWFAAINGENKLPRVHDKKLSIMALCALMEMSPSAIPNSLMDGWPSVVGGALGIFKDLPKAVESELLTFLFPHVASDKSKIIDRKALEDAFMEDDDDDDIIDDTKLLNFNEEEGVCSSFYVSSELIQGTEDVWDEDSAYLEMLAREVFKFAVTIIFAGS